MCTTMSALAATSLVSVPSGPEPFSAEPCVLTRTDAHHSEGLDTWNAAYPRPTSRLDAVMVFLSFPDSHPLTSPDELAADHFPMTSRFFDRASYGKFSLRAHPVKRWIRMPRSSTAYAIQRDWTVAHRAAYLRDALAASDPHVDYSRYDIVYFVADPDAPGVDSDATKVVNLDRPMRADGADIRRVVTVFENHPPDRLVLAHETGHVFDLPDLYHRPVDGKGDWDTHVGDWDLMGSQFALAPDLFGWHKWKLGWLEPRQVRCVQEGGPVRLTLEPLGAGPRHAGDGRGGGAVVRSGAGHQAGGGAHGRGHRPGLRGARPGRQRPRGLPAGGAGLPGVQRHPLGARPRRGDRRPPAHRGVLGGLGLSPAGGRPGRPGRELHGPRGSGTGGRGGPHSVRRVDGEDHHGRPGGQGVLTGRVTCAKKAPR
ncbi:M6 family metalloprotease-like protein [Streptomyces albogriseolus]